MKAGQRGLEGRAILFVLGGQLESRAQAIGGFIHRETR
jgi:hypothetical protein